MPHQYISWLASPELAAIHRVASPPPGTVEARFDNECVEWVTGGELLRIKRSHYFGSRVAPRTSRGTPFIGIVLSFGHHADAGGVFVVTGPPDQERWFNESVARLIACQGGPAI
jgi:hypothetical protein